MGTFNHSAVITGDFYFCRDNSYFAWLTKWITAGWNRRDDMTVPTHMGFFYKNATTGQCVWIESEQPGVVVSPISKRTNQPNDCPGIMEIWRPLPWVYGLHNGQQVSLSDSDRVYYAAYYRACIQNYLPGWVGMKAYDIAWMAQQVTHISWQVDDKVSCSELIWVVLKQYLWTSFCFFQGKAGSGIYTGWQYKVSDAVYAAQNGYGYMAGNDWRWGWMGTPLSYILVLTDNPSPLRMKEAACSAGYPGICHQVIPKSSWWVA
jgi:hypothetical protein